MRSHWNLLSPINRWLTCMGLIVGIISVAAMFTDAAIPILMGAMLIWLPTTFIAGWRTRHATRRVTLAQTRVDRLRKMLDQGPPFNLAELPPEDQEEIHMTWARYVLNSRRH